MNSSFVTLSALEVLSDSTVSAVKIRWKSEKNKGASGEVWMNEINDPYQLALGRNKIVNKVLSLSAGNLLWNSSASTFFQLP